MASAVNGDFSITLIPDFFAIRESGMRESVCPVNVRSHSGQPCALCRTGDFCVLATARHTRVCLRVAVLHKSPRCAAAVRLTAAKQAAFGIIECVRRYGAAFFSRARSAVGFSRAIRGEEASPVCVALLLRCASKRRFLPCSPLARASREPKPPRVATLVHQALPHRLARQTIAYILHVLPGASTGFSPRRPTSFDLY